jgi:hypothetical protein
LRTVDLADRGTRFVIEPVSVEDLAQVALADIGEGFTEATPLARAMRGLDDAFVLRGRLDHLAALEDRVRRGLLDVDVLARLAGPNGRQRMPMVWGRDNDRIDVLIVQQLAQVGVGLDTRVVTLELVDLRHQVGLVAIA